MSKNTETILLRLKPETKALYQQFANEDSRPLAQYVRLLLEKGEKDYNSGRDYVKKQFEQELK